MTTMDGDDDRAGWRKVDIDCKPFLPVSIAFTDSPRMIVSGERHPDVSAGRLLRYHVVPDSSDERNAPQNLDAIDVESVDRAVASKDGKWVVVIMGTNVSVRNMTTDEVVKVGEHALGIPVHAIDISPDSTRFATGAEDKVARVFSINTGNLLLKVGQHNGKVLGVKFSPNGEYLATAAFGDPIQVHSIRGGVIFQTNNDVVYGPAVNAQTTPQSSICIPLGWSCDSKRVFALSSGKVMMSFQTSQGRHDRNRRLVTVTWFQESVPGSNDATLCSLATNGRIIACTAGSSLSFWDSVSSSKIGPTITFQDSILSLALSADGSYLACGRSDKKITAYLLRDIIPLHAIVDPTSHLPFINVDHETLKPWMEQDLGTADKTLRWEREPRSYNSFANHALILAHSQDWHNALESAKKSLAARPSTIGHIAVARALAGQGQRESALEKFDAVFHTCGGEENRFLLLIKAILLFLSGERKSAVVRVNYLISVVDNSEKYNCLQVLGNMYLLQGHWKGAFESFERARELSFYHQGHHLTTILLIFGPSFEERDITLRYPWRQAVVT